MVQWMPHAPLPEDVLLSNQGIKWTYTFLLKLLPTATGALTVAERVWRELGVLHTGPERTLRVTASVGVASFPHHAVGNADQLVRSADESLYRAKHEGRNRICVHSALSAPERSAPP